MSMNFLALLAVGLAVLAVAPLRAADPIKPADGNPVVILETSKGNIKLELFKDKAPITVKNFLDYVDSKHYDGTIFHRVIGKENSEKDFMIQGGGFDKDMNQKKTKAAIVNEAANGVSNLRGTVAMARTNDPDSATSQFFINVIDNKFLDKSGSSAGYCVFGRVIDGMDVVDKIKAVKTGSKSGMQNVPTETIEIKTAKLEKK